jgi:cell division protease FtsH
MFYFKFIRYFFINIFLFCFFDSKGSSNNNIDNNKKVFILSDFFCGFSTAFGMLAGYKVCDIIYSFIKNKYFSKKNGIKKHLLYLNFPIRPFEKIEQVAVDKEVKDFLISCAKVSLKNNFEVSLPNTVVLYGESGVGKTFFASAIAGSLDLPILNIDQAFMDDFTFENITIYDILEHAYKYSPCVVHIENIEHMSKKFFESLGRFLKYGMFFSKPIYLIISTRSPLLIRENKINKNPMFVVQFIKKPDLENRVNILIGLKKEFNRIIFSDDVNWQEIGMMTEGMTPEDLSSFMQKVVNYEISKSVNFNDDKVKIGNYLLINESSIKETLIKIRKNDIMIIPSLDSQDPYYKNINDSIVEKTSTKFSDIVGCQNIKEAVKGIIAYLKNPNDFRNAGIRSPKGILFSGKPGCGKTLMARAIAGESNISCIILNGSEFINKYVGIGASKVREAFALARAHAPCLIVIDEIDAIAMKRMNNPDGGGEEYIQTLNQLLAEIDGFKKNSLPVVVIGITNRPEVLDEAILRAGRLEEHFSFPELTLNDREEMISLYTKGKKFDDAVSVRYIAQKISNFSGADIEFFINKASIISFEKKHEKITWDDIEEAYLICSMGYEIKNLTVKDFAYWETACHEIGHTLCYMLQEKNNCKIDSVTIVPRDMGKGTYLGLTKAIEDEDIMSWSKDQCIQRIVSSLGGMMAEKIMLGYTTTGVSNDLKNATNIAKNMITKFGMGETLCVVSEETETKEIKEAVEKILQECKETCYNLLLRNKNVLEILAKELLNKKTLSREQIEKIIKNNSNV